MKQAITVALAALAALLLLKTCSGPAVVVKEVVKSDTVTLVKIDTVTIEKPVPVHVVEIRMDTLTVYRNSDTVLVPVPIRRYAFRDSLYSLDVSGFQVSIDRMEVYPRTVYRTIHTSTERTVTDKKRWGLGIQAGYGYDFGTKNLMPYVGVGIQYSLWRW